MEPSARAQLLSDSLIHSLKDKASASPRLRINHNFHSGPGDNPHRFLNVLARNTYIQPHRHSQPPKAESFIVIEGYVAFLILNDEGAVTESYILGSGPLPELPASLAQSPIARGIDVAAGVWHTLLALTPYAVCYEVKPGPWDPKTDKEFAPFAPAEGDDEVAAYLRKLLA